jgi:hypothetical protein
MSDGKEVAVRSWDNATRNRKFTKTGRAFYRNSVDRYVIKIPARVYLQRKNGTWYTREDSLPSTATPLGEINVPTTLSEAQQLTRLRRQVDAFLAGLEEEDGDKILMAGYETWLYDPEGTIEYNRESVDVRPDGQARVEAVMHRPLRDAWPLSFGLKGICDESLHDTAGQCVAYQLAAVLRTRKGEKPFDMGQVTPLFQCLFGTEGDATYKRFVLYLLFWALLTVFFVYDMACLRMTLPARRAAGDGQAVVSTQEDGETWQQAGARLALAIFWQFVARSWVYCSILAIEFIPILLFDVRVLGPFGFVVLFLVPFAGFCLLASVFAVVGEVYGRSVFATSLVFSGIMANLIGAALTFS